MRYLINRRDLQNELLVEILQTLSDCYSMMDAELYVVGATARDVMLRLLKVSVLPRRTLDVDVAIALKDWSQYDRLTELMLQCNFVKAKENQRFFYCGKANQYRYEVDVVPFGELAVNEMIAWPPEGSPVMSVRCFMDVMNQADIVQVDDRFSFKVASLSGQFLIKYDTWLDRHSITSKDAADMAFILQNVYIAYALSRQCLPDEINLDANRFDVVVAGAEWIASDLRTMLNEEHRLFYANSIYRELELNGESPLLNDLFDVSDSRKYELFQRAIRRIAEILSS